MAPPIVRGNRTIKFHSARLPPLGEAEISHWNARRVYFTLNRRSLYAPMSQSCEASDESARVRPRRGRASRQRSPSARRWPTRPAPYDWSASPPRESREAFVEWMVKNRGEDPYFLGERFHRFEQWAIAHHDVWDEADMRAFLLTPREEFVTAENLDRAYEWHHLNIGFAYITGLLSRRRRRRTVEIGGAATRCWRSALAQATSPPNPSEPDAECLVD